MPEYPKGLNLTNAQIRAMNSTFFRLLAKEDSGNTASYDSTSLNLLDNSLKGVHHLPTVAPTAWAKLTGTVPHSNQDKALVDLLALMQISDTPHYHFPRYIEWVHKLHQLKIIEWGSEGKGFSPTH